MRTIVLITALLVASPAWAAQPVTPIDGARTNSHPTFTWSLNPGETSGAIYIARKPDTTPQGQFYSENVETSDIFFDARQSWSPERALYAGDHWWNLSTYDGNYNETYSAPSLFTVKSELAILRVRITRYLFLREISFDVRWVTNVRNVLVDVQLRQGGRLVGRKRERHETIISRDPDNAYLEVRSRARRGSRLTAIVQVSGMGKTNTLRRSFRTP